MRAEAVPSGRRRRAIGGFTLLELLVASTVLMVALGLATALFASQARLNSLVTAQATVRDQVNLTMQLLGSELSLVGQTLSFDAVARVTSVAFEVCPEVAYSATATTLSCLEVTDDSSGPIVRLAYADSLTPNVADACRVASYRMQNETLQRANIPCASDGIDFAFDEAAYQDIIDNVVAFDIELVCSDGAELSTYPVGISSECNPSGAYPRAIRFAVVARAGTSARRSPFSYRPPWFDAADAPLATCGDGDVCFGLAQEFSMPNMNKEW